VFLLEITANILSINISKIIPKPYPNSIELGNIIRKYVNC
jgi:hypothetical protein